MFENILTAAKFKAAHSLYRFPRSEAEYASREEYELAATTLNKMIQTIESHEFTTSIFANNVHIGHFQIEYYDDIDNCVAAIWSFSDRIVILEY